MGSSGSLRGEIAARTRGEIFRKREFTTKDTKGTKVGRDRLALCSRDALLGKQAPTRDAGILDLPAVACLVH